MSINPTILDGRFKNHRWIESDSIDAFRPRLASDIVHLKHCGWYVDEDCGETTVGIVLRLSHKRGFLAGCSDSWNGDAPECSCMVEDYVYDSEDIAARAADQIAERYAEQCREDDEKFREEQRIAEEEEG